MGFKACVSKFCTQGFVWVPGIEWCYLKLPTFILKKTNVGILIKQGTIPKTSNSRMVNTEIYYAASYAYG
jgi:hypothetical protein